MSVVLCLPAHLRVSRSVPWPAPHGNASPLPTGCGCGGCGRGDPSPTPQLRAGFARCGGGTRAPGGGAPCLGVGRPGTGALPPPTSRLFRRAAGADYPLALGVGGAGMGTRRQPHSARSCGLALRAVGVARGCPGGRILPGFRASGVGLSPTPKPLVRSGVRPGPTTGWLWLRGVRARGPVTNPSVRALARWLCALWGRHEDAQAGRYLPGCGASGDGCSPTPDLSSIQACGRGPLPTGSGCGGCGRGPVTNPTARTLASWLCALWGRHEGARGGGLLPGCGASGVGLSPTPDHSSFRACGRGPLPTGCGCGGFGLGDTSPTPQRALLRAGFARCGGGTRAPGGAPLALMWGVPGRALSHPRPLVRSGVRPGPTTHWLCVRGVRAWGPVTNPTARALASWLCALWGRHEGARRGRLLPGCGASGVGRSPTSDHSSVRACGRGPLATGCGCGGCGRGDPSPTPQLRADFARCGGGTRAPGGGAPCLGVGRPGTGALPPPTSRLFRRAAGADYPLALGVGGAGMGTRRQPHSARSCELALRAVGVARGCPGGAHPSWVSGVLGRALSHPQPLVRSGVRPGPTTSWLWLRGLRARGPVTNPSVRALARWLCALWGRHEDAEGGRYLPGCGASGDGCSPTPDLSSIQACGRGPLPTGSGCGGCGRGPVTNPTARTLASWLCALWGRHEGARGGRLLPGCGASGVGLSPTPDHSYFRACGRGPLPTGCGCGGFGLGDTSPTPQRALLRAGFARCGGGTRAPGGAPLALVWGVPGRALSHPRPLVRSGVRPGPTTHWLCVRGVQAWGPVTNPTARALASWLCALLGRHEGARRGRLLPGCGASGVGRSPTSDHSSVRACGRGPLPTGCGCGGCGHGDPSPTPQRTLLRAGFARCGSGMRVPGGGASCLGSGRPGFGPLPPPTSRSFGRAAGAHYPLAVGAGDAGMGTRHQSHSARFCELALPAVGAA